MTNHLLTNMAPPVLPAAVNTQENATQAAPQPAPGNGAGPASAPNHAQLSVHAAGTEAKLRKTFGRSKEKAKAKKKGVASKDKAKDKEAVFDSVMEEQLLSEEDLSDAHSDAPEQVDVIVGTGDRMWYMAMVAADGVPVREIRTIPLQRRMKARKA